jgi:hypothetical protein
MPPNDPVDNYVDDSPKIVKNLFMNLGITCAWRTYFGNKICSEQVFSLSPAVDSIILQGILEACGILYSIHNKSGAKPLKIPPRS